MSTAFDSKFAQDFLISIVQRAIETYNYFHKPEAIAKLVDLKNNEFSVEFRGSFCLTCGVRDWIEDLVYVFKSMGYHVELLDVVDSGDNVRIGVFRFLGESSDR